MFGGRMSNNIHINHFALKKRVGKICSMAEILLSQIYFLCYIYYVGRYVTLCVASSKIRTHNVSGDKHWLHSYKSNYHTITTATAPRNKYITGIFLKVVLSTITLTLHLFLTILFDFWFLVFNATFSNISAISWRPVLVLEEAGVPGENHRS
jgi:cell division septal protein FtsQ